MKNLVVLGGGESGAGAAILGKDKGYHVFLSDSGSLQDKYKQMLNNEHIEWEEGTHSEEKILQADLVIKSPGIPKEVSIVQKIMQKRIPIISEIEFAGRYTQSKMICITGSNGKTTTTSLTYHLFKTAGYDVGLAGNIGKSLALQVARDPHPYYVIELSSFQLDDMFNFKADIAILLNITPDHLDRYNYCMQNYVDAKMRILQNQTADDCFIYWADDPIIQQEIAKRQAHTQGTSGIASTCYPFALNPQEGLAGFVQNDIFTLVSPQTLQMPQSHLSLQGTHNVYNSLAAALAARAAGISQEAIIQGLSSFPGVEHRLEKVGTFKGIHYINDSKATNVDACRYALESMTTPTILILGGLDKGNDYEQIRQLVAEKCKALVFLGADNTVLHNFFDSMNLPIADTHSMEDCVKACQSFATMGDTVLLSPCCASFDLFKNMGDRGRQFKHLVSQP